VFQVIGKKSAGAKIKAPRKINARAEFWEFQQSGIFGKRVIDAAGKPAGGTPAYWLAV
jgi:hypothetical protein